MRLSLILAILILVALGCNVYAVADRVQNAERTQRNVEAHIAEEQEGLRVLSAEWTYLTNPDRLERLATSHFGLAPSEGQQYIELAAIPMRDFMNSQPQADAPQLAANTAKAPKTKAGEEAPQIGPETVALPQALQSLPDLAATQINATAGSADE